MESQLIEQERGRLAAAFFRLIHSIDWHLWICALFYTRVAGRPEIGHCTEIRMRQRVVVGQRGGAQ